MTSFLSDAAYRIKKATGDDQTFEDSLASIGRSSLVAKAPALANYEIGFQVLDKDEDNTRAVGVFGYRVGKKLLYVPMFYRDGVVKGTEQLRDPKRKITVPLTDNWINKYKGERGDSKPDRISRSTTQNTAQPSLWQLKYPPTKWANETNWADEARLDLALAIGKRPSLWPQLDSEVNLLKLASETPALMDAFADWYTKYAWFAKAVRKFYAPEEVAGAVKRAAAVKAAAERKDPLDGTIFAKKKAEISLFPTKQAKTKPAVSVVRVKMVNLSIRPIHPDMDFDKFTRHELESGRNVYEDFRKEEEISDADVWLGGETAHKTSIRNPEHNGVYEVIGADNKIHKCAVLTPLLGWGTAQNRCLIVRLSDGAHTVTHRNAVWVQGEADKPTFRDWVHGLPKVDKGKFPSDEVAAISLDETDVGMATAPMRIHDGGEVYSSWDDSNSDRPYWAPFDPWEDRPDLHAGSRRESAPRRVSVLETTGRPLIRANHLYLPEGSRWIKLSGGYDNRFRQAEGSEPDRYLLWTNRAKTEKKALLQVEKTAAAYVVNDAERYIDRNDLEEALIVRHGLKVAKARELSAHVDKHKTAVAAVKYAKGGPGHGLSYDSPTAPAVSEDRITNPQGFADDILPTVTSSLMAQAIPDLQEQAGARDRSRAYPTEQGLQVSAPGVGNSGDTSGGKQDYDPSDDVSAVSDAAQSGRKELFDTAALAALVKHTKLRSLLDKCAPRMLRQVSDLGDVLAHMAWNTEEWTDQFGRSEVGPIEDQVRDLFDGLGDLYLTLQEKTIAGDPDAGVLPEENPGDAADSDQ
jgi:hypothetical protein